MSGTFVVASILPDLGFQAAEPGLKYDWYLRADGLQLEVTEGVNRFFAPSLHFGGTFNNVRTMQFLDFTIDQKAASREEALALIGYHLKELPVDQRPDWVTDALRLKAHIPWMRKHQSENPIHHRHQHGAQIMRTPGRSLELYYIDGRPDGMLTAELFNWTGHVLMAPRTQIAVALARPEASYAGIYLLLGEFEGKPLAYIGEGEDISARIRSHDVKKDWWSSAVLVTAAANKLNKAHVRYLEARLIAEAKSIGRIPLENGTAPTPPSLSEADIAKMEAFLENLMVVLPAVRVDMFIQRARAVAPAASIRQNVETARPPVEQASKTLSEQGEVHFRLELPRKNFAADAVLNERGEFVVLAGSQARKPQYLAGYQGLYDELVRAGVIASDDHGQLRFTASYVFSSPSAAASVATGTSANGATGWKHAQTGVTYKDWEAGRLGVSTESLLKELDL